MRASASTISAGSRPSSRSWSSTAAISSAVPRIGWPWMRRPAWRDAHRRGCRRRGRPGCAPAASAADEEVGAVAGADQQHRLRGAGLGPRRPPRRAWCSRPATRGAPSSSRRGSAHGSAGRPGWAARQAPSRCSPAAEQHRAASAAPAIASRSGSPA